MKRTGSAAGLAIAALMLLGPAGPRGSEAAAFGASPAATQAAAASARPAGIVFPPDAGVIDVTQPPYGAKGDGKTDDTAAIQKALDDHPNRGAVIYLPNGTYLVSDTLRWPHGDRGGWEEKNTILQGQSTEGAVLRLPDRCPAYGDPARPKAVLWTGQKPAQRFRNAVRNLTVDTGMGNPGACGVQFMANNQGCMRDVVIRSADGQGHIGLDMAYTDEIGPLLVKYVTVIGFDIGIKTAHGVNGETLEHITLRGQNQYGLYNDGQCVTVRGLASENAVPAVYNGGGSSFLVILDSQLRGAAGASGQPAILNKGAILARNVRTSGYQAALAGAAETQKGPDLAEVVSPPALSVFSPPGRSLGLPIKETPEVPWDALDQWVSPLEFGGKPDDGGDDTEAIQKAIDAGKPTVYLPRGSWRIRDTVVIRGAVRRLIGCEAWLDVTEPLTRREAPMFRFEDGQAPVVVFERVATNFARGPFWFLEHAASRTLVLSSISVNLQQTGAYRNSGTGPLFIEDVVGADWRFRKQAVWARQFNVENTGLKVLNDGATLWILNLKTEQGGTLIETRGGGRTELLGGFCYTCVPAGDAPMFINDNAAVSLSIGEACFIGQPYKIIVREVRGRQTRDLTRDKVPGRAGGCLLPLYTGYGAGR